MKSLKQIFKQGIIALFGLMLLASWTPDNAEIQKSKKETINFAGDVSRQKAKSSYSFGVEYKAKKKREIVVEIWKGGKWIATQIMVVKKGSGTAVVNVKLKEKLRRGSDYLLKLQLRPVGSTWKEAVAVGAVPDVKMM